MREEIFFGGEAQKRIGSGSGCRRPARGMRAWRGAAFLGCFRHSRGAKGSALPTALTVLWGQRGNTRDWYVQSVGNGYGANGSPKLGILLH